MSVSVRRTQTQLSCSTGRLGHDMQEPKSSPCSACWPGFGWLSSAAAQLVRGNIRNANRQSDITHLYTHMRRQITARAAQATASTYPMHSGSNQSALSETGVHARGRGG